ncbi:hypothetical protein DT73_18920 [Mangrovibacter sp. MFB070]|nr:hypothetical protein DT73_18920 [Mangrovibacter sp. MFB070]
MLARQAFSGLPSFPTLFWQPDNGFFTLYMQVAYLLIRCLTTPGFIHPHLCSVSKNQLNAMFFI